MDRIAHSLSIEHVSKHYGAVAALDDVSLQVDRGQFLTLLGPSGSGKTTLLMAIAGFVAPGSGHISLDGQQIDHLPPEKRNFGMVFQGYALFPHLSVFENVAFPLRVRRRLRDEIEKRVRQALDIVQLGGPRATRMPNQLSGGQQQRAALARALVFEAEPRAARRAAQRARQESAQRPANRAEGAASSRGAHFHLCDA